MTKDLKFNRQYPSIEDLRTKSKKKIPKFSFEYLDGGTNEGVNLYRNTNDIRKVKLMPDYLSKNTTFSMETKLFGNLYEAPFGISPIGLQGLMWPGATEILAKSAKEYNIPFILSTVATASLEKVAKITDGKAWFQLYYPIEKKIREDIIKRAEINGYKTLVLLCDTPVFGYRNKELKNGLSLPPRITIKNVLQMLIKGEWFFKTLLQGPPNFENLKPYMGKNMNIKQLGKFMESTFSGRLTEKRIADIRSLWKGKIVLKGVVNPIDMNRAIKLGLDGVIISNHGGRQIDAGESTISSLERLVRKYKNKIKIMLDSGIRDGVDVGRVLAKGAEFTFLGRSFMYGVSALGSEGGDHTISIIKKQLQQVMEQIGCKEVKDFPNFLIKE